MRTILISGANRGIGRSIAERALSDGHKVSLGLRNLDSIKGTKLDPLISGKENILLNNYHSEDIKKAESWVQSSINYFQTFDTIIHCAGIFNYASLLCKDDEIYQFDDLWKINVMGPLLLTRAAWTELCKHKDSRIIVLVSMSGKRSKSTLAGYTMSKFALMGLCQTIRNEGWEKGVRVTAICPGWVNTDMAKNIQSTPKEKMTQPDDLAKITCDILKLPNTCIPFEIAVNCLLET